ncbi:MAG TPA: hypothetical protein DCM28_14945 [Phycisphaerales bacterium]|nr:hypothetical protein [Phycisphaerales bacterium]
MYRTRDLVAGIHAGCPGKVKITACFDIDKEKASFAASEYDAVACHSEEMFLKQEMDVVLICLPPYLHAQTFERVAKAGFDVYLEKPICINDEDRQRVLETISNYNVRCYVGISYRYTNPFAKVAEIARRPDAGQLIGIHHHWLQGPGTMQGPTNWRHRMEQSGGQLNHHCCHLLDWMHWIGGPITTVTATSHVHDQAVLQHEEQELSAAFTFEQGGMAVFNLSQHAHTNSQFGMVHLQNLAIHYAWGKDTYVKVYKTRQRAADEIYEWDATSGNDPGTQRDAMQMADFVDAYLNDKPMPCSVEDGVRTYDLAKAVRLSCESGRRIVFNELVVEV